MGVRVGVREGVRGGEEKGTDGGKEGKRRVEGGNRRGVLKVYVCSGEIYEPMDGSNDGNPYVRIMFGGVKKRTSTQNANLFPIWGEGMGCVLCGWMDGLVGCMRGGWWVWK
jgi:hypothetical protein